MKTHGKLRWQNSRGDNYWYYVDDEYGYGHVIRRKPTIWQACGSYESIYCKTLREAKVFVEKSWRKKRTKR